MWLMEGGWGAEMTFKDDGRITVASYHGYIMKQPVLPPI